MSVVAFGVHGLPVGRPAHVCWHMRRVPETDAVRCRKTSDGRTYPVDLPWGNMGISIGAVCAAGIYNKMAADTKVRQEASCFIEEQLGYITNHKCSRKGEACRTTGKEGYSYIVGCAAHMTRAHCMHVVRTGCDEACRCCTGCTPSPRVRPSQRYPPAGRCHAVSAENGGL